MADYLGIGDTVTQFQPFQPDFNYYSNILGVKQQQYNQGLQRINSLYTSTFNSPLTREDNIQRREDYFKTIDSERKRIATTDLSIDQNVSAAQKLFEPILKDKYLINDIAFTKKLQNSYKNADQYRYCTDPDKCGGKFSEAGLKALGYRAREFQEASPEQSLGMRGPDYVPDQDVFGKSMEAMKKAGFNVSMDYIKDGYIVTNTNGTLLYDKEGGGVLPQFLLGMFGNDSAVQAMYQTRAYVHQNEFIDQYMATHGVDRNTAESQYVNTFIAPAVISANRSKAAYDQMMERLSTETAAIELADKQGKIAEGDGTTNDYDRLMALIDHSKNAETVHQRQQNLIRTAPNIDNAQGLKARAQQIMAGMFMQEDLGRAAYTYAMGTAKQELKADPYSLAAFNSKLSYSNASRLKAQDHQYELETLLYKHNLDMQANTAKGYDAQSIGNFLAQKGIDPQELVKIGVDPDNIQKKDILKLKQAGLFSPEEAKAAQTLPPNTSSYPFENTYIENKKLETDAVNRSVVGANAFLKDMLGSMVKAYRQADVENGKDAQAKKVKILLDTVAILKGTGVDYNKLLNGELPLDVVNNISNVGDAAGNAMNIRNNNAGSRIYQDGWDDASMAQLQLDIQAAKGLQDINTKQVNEAFRRVRAGVSPNDLTGGVLYSMVDNGRLLPPTEAYQRYYDREVARQISTGYTPNTTAITKAFDENYARFSKQINTQLSSINNPVGASGAGGAQNAKTSVSLSGDASAPLHPDYQMIKKTLNSLSENPENKTLAFIFSTNRELPATPQTAPEKAELFDLIRDNIGTKGVKVDMQVHNIPQWFDADALASSSSIDYAIQTGERNVYGENVQLPGQMVEPRIATDFTISEDAYRKFKGLKKSDEVTLEDRTVRVVTSADNPAVVPLAQKLTRPPASVYMNQPNASTTIDLGYKGKAVIENAGNGFVMKTYSPTYVQDDNGNLITQWRWTESKPLINVSQLGQDDQLSFSDYVKVTTANLNQAYQQYLNVSNYKKQNNATGPKTR